MTKLWKTIRISIINLKNLKPKKNISCILYHNDQIEEQITLQHSYNESQIEWFRAGSALNILRSMEAENDNRLNK